jgi:hypothetical protein
MQSPGQFGARKGNRTDQQSAHIYRELPAHPHQLSRICLQLLDARGMGVACVYGIAAKGVDDIEVMTEHVRVLVIFFGDVLADGGRER